ncbi:flagellar basal body rod protein FlgB [Magnetospirillum sp. SS-4]|uniref:flagellar basal body rod protein FlgB n=1 Tax=Magnetospirillum sp. SS-4 TaxID=2681465 RepID=UPI00138298AC|nr:flagellar basal body rod protein FlgB [Magnetospirillum sp. SS-4]CAA7617519.1 Flagellar basal body protein [Magnetospirillum sp. SS-4]
MLGSLNIFKMTKARMDWLAERQEVLAENIANANTPRYLPRDLKAPDFKEVLAGTTAVPVNAVATNAKHIVPAQAPDPFKTVVQRKAFESTPDGNAVILEEQMAKLGESSTAYNTSAALFQKYQKMIRMAVGGR